MSIKTKRADRNMPLRIDFALVNVSTDPELREYVFAPDPERYKHFTDESGEWYLDLLDPRSLAFDLRAIEQALALAQDIPVTYMRPDIPDVEAYIASRLPSIREGLINGLPPSPVRDSADDELRTVVSERREFVIASVDLVGSTKLSQAVNDETFANIVQTFSSELAQMCLHFHGRPLKFMGDGAILYFPIGSFIRRHDMAIDLAVSLRDLILTAINSVLVELGLPQLACRIGIDSGTAIVKMVGDSGSTNHVDIIGELVSIATKIEKAAPVNGICVGESTVINSHTHWLKHMKLVPPPVDWPYHEPGSDAPYRIYLLDIPASAS